MPFRPVVTCWLKSQVWVALLRRTLTVHGIFLIVNKKKHGHLVHNVLLCTATWCTCHHARRMSPFLSCQWEDEPIFRTAVFRTGSCVTTKRGEYRSRRLVVYVWPYSIVACRYARSTCLSAGGDKCGSVMECRSVGVQ